ncbi:hypothetical protein [Pseudomonas sp. W15Feb9B]|uniref:hypothetical protein n=1 Tax=Pseudomonas sp. W15Feb9B TaxID=550743 RepID=UPI000597667D|nr:hypothetical protein [Pseudomonas sp. W15Feb9B]KIK83087.1 hypothetical protein OC71_25200 [Pseudomonas sp. W15Feb9B]
MESSKGIISEILDAKSIEILKGLGSEAEICKVLNEVYHPFELAADTYEKLFAAVDAIRSSLVHLKSNPFVSRQAEIVFCLTELNGTARSARLGITDEMYENKLLAKKWYKSLAQIVHSDRLSGDSRPMQELQKIYESITFESADDE